jgi:hypothetical protein
MKPVNSKSMFHYLMITLEQLDNNEIDASKASVRAKVVGRATNLLNYELKRAQLMTNTDFKNQFREIEMKGFD